ncbi:MAG: ABC transporter permease [Cyanobacteria bacterium]|nr:ABC transporter permease [Cyanobacteria bacterium CG_2015-16_32_12]NCO77251.1 ABC transporter permease [Cyanobacteria bacterium CG_2015-22_32_23]NCQ05414.1 ABC transporter permease [Cyanobacteria bacterium CG_2015-09_32_10]NCQ42898.1 ABC transporter permease [Cyanobacteria bacterium CG_2015-04_32_10]NCS86113.1 ABC transporter permease [Cyanobacteria bacterium CG_2015-02_32_10]
MNINRIFAIASNGFREVIRDRILYVIGFFVLLLILASRILPPIAVSTDEKIFLDLGIGAISFLGAIVAIFVGTGLINKEIEKKTVLILVPKPLTATEFIIGKHLGLSGVLVVLITTMTMIYFALMSLLQINYPLQSLLIAMAYIFLELALLTAIAMTFGVFTSSILATLLSFGVYIMGHLSRDLLQLGKITENPSIEKITKILFLILPDLARLNLKNEAVYNILPNTGELISSLIYAILYIILLLSITIFIFSRRQF